MAYLHLGGDVAIRDQEVIAILDLDSQVAGSASEEFLEIAKEEGFVHDLAGEQPKSAILATKNRIFLSPISTWTLKRRAVLDHLLSGDVKGFKFNCGTVTQSEKK